MEERKKRIRHVPTLLSISLLKKHDGNPSDKHTASQSPVPTPVLPLYLPLSHSRAYTATEPRAHAPSLSLGRRQDFPRPPLPPPSSLSIPHQAAACLNPHRRREDSNTLELLRPSSTNPVPKQPEEALVLDIARG